MAEFNVFYFRSEIPGRLLDFGAYVSAAKVALTLPEDDLESLKNDLSSYRGFLSNNVLKELVHKSVKDGEKAEGLFNLLNLTDIHVQNNNRNIDAFLDQLARWQQAPDNQGKLSTDELARLKHLVSSLATPAPARLRQAKAERLAATTGLRADAIDLVCDVRPVFDDSRTRIEGLIPFTTLRIVATGVDKFPVAFETVLSAKDVQALLKKAEEVVRKLNALGQLAERAALPIPAVDLTETSN
ncbi:MAG TPA: hypothetical protein VK395_28400 [Gemmataceae bacterium]|nr:hypothetical protein [Gemmataceae bacterium]